MLSYTATADLWRIGQQQLATAVLTVCAKTENDGDETQNDKLKQKDSFENKENGFDDDEL